MPHSDRIKRKNALLLAQLADPDAPCLDLAALDDATIGQIAHLAEQHGVLPVDARKLAGRLPAERGDDIRLRVGQSMLLEHKRHAVSNGLEQAGVAFAVVKGPVFARLLYDNPADRPFTDIDVLVRHGDMDKVGPVMREQGFSADRKESWDNSERDEEFKWTLADNRSVLFELHGNLVHYPMLRRRVSFGYKELVSAGRGDPEAPQALLSTAIVHAACGHKFHRLQMIVDVLQAARRLPDDRVDDFVRVARELGFALEAAVSLSLAGSLFGDHRVAKMPERFGASVLAAIGRRLISPGTILQVAAPAHRGSWTRRKTFRMLQYIA